MATATETSHTETLRPPPERIRLMSLTISDVGFDDNEQASVKRLGGISTKPSQTIQRSTRLSDRNAEVTVSGPFLALLGHLLCC